MSRKKGRRKRRGPVTVKSLIQDQQTDQRHDWYSTRARSPDQKTTRHLPKKR